MKKLILIWMILSFVSPNLYPGHEIPESRWEKATKGIDYTENYRERKPKSKKDRVREHKPLKNRKINAGFLKVLALFIVVPVLLALLILVMVNIRSTTSVKKAGAFNPDVEVDDPDKYEHKELGAFLQEALVQRNFRLAIRIHFLQLIKELKDKGHISWERKKTNGDYLVEVQGREYRKSFQKLVVAFEKVWYADYSVDEEGYKLLATAFSDIQTTIKP